MMIFQGKTGQEKDAILAAFSANRTGRTMQNIKDLEALLRSDVSIITIETQEGPAPGLFDRIRLSVPAPLFHWTVTEGLQRLD
ncbi:MAG TPA: hypothetical protein VLN56_10415 [Gammaproteobacteria bacterium]|nr:hypothetical protein [Gammaproteobacteria bacterium]